MELRTFEFEYQNGTKVKLPFNFIETQDENLQCKNLIDLDSGNWFILVSHTSFYTRLNIDEIKTHIVLIFDDKRNFLGVHNNLDYDTNFNGHKIKGRYIILMTRLDYSMLGHLKRFKPIYEKGSNMRFKKLKEERSFWDLFNYKTIIVNAKRFAKVEKDRVALFTNYRGQLRPDFSKIPDFLNERKIIAVKDYKTSVIKYYLLRPEKNYKLELIDFPVRRNMDINLIWSGEGITRGVDGREYGIPLT